MHILLFGNLGQIGQEIEKLAISNNTKVTGFDIKDLDISNTIQLAQAFENNTDSVLVINAAAYTNVEKAEEEPEKAYQINCQGAQNLAMFCRQYNLPLLHISTDYVFSGEKIGPYAETDTIGPLGIYGKTKSAGDQAIENIWQKHIILRVSWVFGRYGNNFVKTMLRLAQERETLNVVADQFGCPTSAADIARVLLEIAEQIAQGKEKWGTYNYCNHPVTTWYDFAVKIIELGRGRFQLKAKQLNKTTTEMFPTKAKRPKNSELLVAKIIEDYGVTRKDWESYLVDMITQLRLS